MPREQTTGSGEPEDTNARLDRLSDLLAAMRRNFEGIQHDNMALAAAVDVERQEIAALRQRLAEIQPEGDGVEERDAMTDAVKGSRWLEHIAHRHNANTSRERE